VAWQRWDGETTGGTTRFELEMWLPAPPAYLQDPVRTAGDFDVFWRARYSTDLPAFDLQGQPATTRQDVVALERGSPGDPPPPGSILVTRSGRSAKGVTVETRFYWPPEPTGIVAGYTAPLAGWEQTTITGLTSTPIVLRGYYSQTYRPEHHNFAENFLFEPRLEEGIPVATLDELEAAGVRLLYFGAGFGPDGVFKKVGPDGSISDL
jgi:hypothetical protein